MEAPLKTAILGTGVWASICMKTIREIPDLAPVVCYDPSPEKRESFAREFSVPAVADEKKLWETPGLEAVLILTPNFLHQNQVLQAAARGLHTFVEKPMGVTGPECRVMAETAERSGTTLFVGHNTRRETRFRRMKSMLEQGEIGRPVLAEITFTSSAGLAPNREGWRYDRERTPAVALAQIGIHAIDVLHSLFGLPENLHAWIENAAMGDGLEDICLARLQFPGNVHVSFVNAYSVPRVRSLNILGTAGNLFSPSENALISQKEGQQDRENIPLATNNTMLEEFQEFVACCRGRRQPETGGREGLTAVEVMDAMLRSARAGGRVETLAWGD
jgi:predicted dehydrogenase